MQSLVVATATISFVSSTNQGSQGSLRLIRPWREGAVQLNNAPKPEHGWRPVEPPGKQHVDMDYFHILLFKLRYYFKQTRGVLVGFNLLYPISMKCAFQWLNKANTFVLF